MFTDNENGKRFTLEKYRGRGTRHSCPNCGKPKEFTRYVDTLGAIVFPDHVGKCNREINCGYHYPPRQYFEAVGISFDREGNVKKLFEQAGKTVYRPAFNPPKSVPAKPVSFIPPDLFQGSLKDYGNNNLAKFLLAQLGREVAATLIARYYVGTAKKWPGANVFWQIDTRGKVRAGKVMLYDPETGRRDKQKMTWAHAVLKLPDFNLQQCFFGEHLLAQNPGKTVAIVESEKTALIASAYLEPKGFIWLASGGLSILKAERCTVLQGRQIVLYPDAGLPNAQDGKTPFEKWNIEADKLRQAGYRVSVSDLLEQKATQPEREKGFDLADYLLRFDLSEFRQMAAQDARQTQPEPPRIEQPPAPELPAGHERRTYTNQITGESFDVLLNADGYPAEWDLEEPQREALTKAISINPVVTETIARMELTFIGAGPIP